MVVDVVNGDSDALSDAIEDIEREKVSETSVSVFSTMVSGNGW